MKFSILALGAAVAGISCANQCAAQLQIDSFSPPRSSEARLVSRNQDIFGDDTAVKSNDSDYFAKSATQAELNDPDSLKAKDQKSEDQAPLSTPSTLSNRPGMPVQAPLGVLAHTPDIGLSSVCWSQGLGCPTPNPVADYMMRNWCTEGLWSAYPCQNARECQRIQQHIHGYNRYTGVSSCGGPVCGPMATAGCSSGACQSPLSNCAQVPAKPTTQLVNDARGKVQISLPAAQSDPIAVEPLPTALPTSLPIALPTELPTAAMQYAQQSVAQPVVTQPVVELPADVPTMPVNYDHSRKQPSDGALLPALPSPSAVPVLASLPTATLR